MATLSAPLSDANADKGLFRGIRISSMRLSDSASARLAAQLDSLRLLLDETIAPGIRQRPALDKWSAHENLAHLARHHEIFLGRLQRILTEDAPLLARYRAEDDPEWPQWPARSPEEVLQRMRALRSRLIEFVQGLTAEQMARTGVHPTFGEMSIPLWIEFFLLHEAHHLYAVMQRLREAP